MNINELKAQRPLYGDHVVNGGAFSENFDKFLDDLLSYLSRLEARNIELQSAIDSLEAQDIAISNRIVLLEDEVFEE